MDLESTVAELLRTMLDEEPGEYLSSFIVDLAAFLVQHGCDFYKVMRIVLCSGVSACSETDAEKIYKIVPSHRKLKSLASTDIHGMISRWTATPYHSGPIKKVVRDIQLKCITKQNGMFVYNSNLNPHNPKSTNDQYLLVVTENGIAFSDLNRKISYHYETGGRQDDSSCNL